MINNKEMRIKQTVYYEMNMMSMETVQLNIERSVESV